MARSIEQIRSAFDRLVPLPFRGPWMHLTVGALHRAEVFVDELVSRVLWGGADQEWLDLHALGRRLYRSDDESDAELLARIRTRPRRVTPDQVLEAVGSVVAAVDESATVELREHFGDGAFDDDLAYFDQTPMLHAFHHFDVVVPDLYDDPTDHRLSAVFAATQSARAHGVTACLVIDTSPTTPFEE